MVYCSEEIKTSQEFQAYKEMTWSNAKVGDEVKVEVESNFKSIAHNPSSCAIKA